MLEQDGIMGCLPVIPFGLRRHCAKHAHPYAGLFVEHYMRSKIR